MAGGEVANRHQQTYGWRLDEPPAGASKEETGTPALLRELEEPLRLRARIWSGNLADMGVLLHGFTTTMVCRRRVLPLETLRNHTSYLMILIITANMSLIEPYHASTTRDRCACGQVTWNWRHCFWPWLPARPCCRKMTWASMFPKIAQCWIWMDMIGCEVSPLSSNLKGKNLLTTALDMGETIVEATEACWSCSVAAIVNSLKKIQREFPWKDHGSMWFLSISMLKQPDQSFRHLVALFRLPAKLRCSWPPQAVCLEVMQRMQQLHMEFLAVSYGPRIPLSPWHRELGFGTQKWLASALGAEADQFVICCKFMFRNLPELRKSYSKWL